MLVLLPASALAESIVLQPGNYNAIRINGQSGVTYTCARAGECNIGAGSSIKNSNGVTLDGLSFRGGSQGLTISGSDNVTVSRSIFTQQSSAGVSVQPGAPSHNVRIIDNQFRNTATGCNYLDPGNCSGRLGNGGIVSYMDYGARLYACDGCEIRGNTFSSVFNHAISLKHSGRDISILDNLFNGCGRTCMELGQEWGGATVQGVVVRGNTLQGAFLNSIRAWNVNGVDMGGNSIGGSGTPVDWGSGGGALEPPYVYQRPVIEDPEARRQRIMADGGPGHSCCDDLSKQESSKASERLERLRQQWARE